MINLLCKGGLYCILPLLISLSMLSSIACTIPFVKAQQDNANFVPYTNNYLGLTFKYPYDWKIAVDEEDRGGFISLISSGEVSVGVSVDTLKPNETGLTLEHYANGYLERQRLFPENSNYKPLEVNTNSYALSGHPAARIIETYNSVIANVNASFKSMTLFTLLDNKVYTIHYDVSPPDKFPNHLQQAQTIIDSFRIISKQ